MFTKELGVEKKQNFLNFLILQFLAHFLALFWIKYEFLKVDSRLIYF